MFHCPQKNSYLQMHCDINPRLINKAVDRAMERIHFDPRDEDPPARPLKSMQPSLFAPCVDVTRAKLGFGRIGLRVLKSQLHSKDVFVQLQAIHTVMDQVQISESAMFLIHLRLVYRLTDLMRHKSPVIREKICIIIYHLASYYQGRKQILSRPEITKTLMDIIINDKKEIRYAAANALRNLARDRFACEKITQDKNFIPNLLDVIQKDWSGIVLLHLKTFENVSEWDPEKPLKENAFQVMRTLFDNTDPRVVAHAMDCMAQLCKHEVGKELADMYDLTFALRKFLVLNEIRVVISAIGLMAYTTLTTRSKWRAKEVINELSRRLVSLCLRHNKPLLQLKAMQVLINLCDCPDMRNHIKRYWERKIRTIYIRTHEEWDGTTECSSYGFEMGHNYRTMCIENVETIKNDYGDNTHIMNVHSYLKRLQEKKDQLIDAINWKPYK